MRDLKPNEQILFGVVHEVEQAGIAEPPVDFWDASTLDFVHPLGTVYCEGQYGFVASGYKWYRFLLSDLANIERS